MKYSQHAIIRKKNNYVILGNTNTGKWIRISQKLYNIFEKFLYLNNSQKEIDFKEIEKLIQTLTDLEVITDYDNNPEEKLRSVTFSITNRCNLQCMHCGYSADPNNEYELSKESIITVISKLKDVDVFAITGGEPMFHRNFPSIAEYIGKNVSGKKMLMTNATLITENNVDLVINNFDGVAISLDAASESTCDKMRGIGVFQKVISSIKILQKKNFRDISLSFTETALNRHETEQFITLCKDLETEPAIRNFLSVGRGYANRDQLVLNNIESHHPGNHLSTKEISEYRKRLVMTTRCGAGIDRLYIQFNGDIYPCPVSGINEKMRMGNINNIDDFHKFMSKKDELEGYQYYTDISLKKIGKCSKCDVKDFCWRCIQEYYSIFPDGKEESKECIDRWKFLNSIVWGD